MSTDALAARFGCSTHAVSDRLRSLGVQARPSGHARAIIDGDWLKHAYSVEGLSGRELADELGLGTTTVYRRLRKLGIEPRARRAVASQETEDWLRDAYLVQRLPVTSIAAELGCSRNGVFRSLRRMGIEPRSAAVLHLLAQLDTEWLRTQYIERGRSSYEIAAEIGCDPKTIWRMLRDRGIPTRTRSEVMRQTGRAQWWGDSNPNYRDGSSNERDLIEIRFRWDEVRLRAYTRDGFKCKRCGDRSHGPGTLHAHHIRTWAGNPDLRFDDGNLVTLCRPCHRWVHSVANAASEFLDHSG